MSKNTQDALAGTLGMLALGAVGTKIWREAKKRAEKNEEKKNKKNNG